MLLNAYFFRKLLLFKSNKIERFKNETCPSKIMIIEEFDSGLRAKISYSGSPRDKTTFIYLPGLGTTGGSAQKFLSEQEMFNQNKGEINLISFTYRGHQGQVIGGFENDKRDLEELIDKLPQFSIQKEKTGLLAVCYGSHVALQYLSSHDDLAFAVLLEPYSGLNSLKAPFKQIAKRIKSMNGRLHLHKVPVGYRYGAPGYFDVNSFLDNDGQGVAIDKIRIPLLVVDTQVHGFFNPDRFNISGYKSTVPIRNRRNLSPDEREHLFHEISGFLENIASKDS